MWRIQLPTEHLKGFEPRDDGGLLTKMVELDKLSDNIRGKVKTIQAALDARDEQKANEDRRMDEAANEGIGESLALNMQASLPEEKTLGNLSDMEKLTSAERGRPEGETDGEHRNAIMSDVMGELQALVDSGVISEDDIHKIW